MLGNPALQELIPHFSIPSYTYVVIVVLSSLVAAWFVWKDHVADKPNREQKQREYEQRTAERYTNRPEREEQEARNAWITAEVEGLEASGLYENINVREVGGRVQVTADFVLPPMPPKLKDRFIFKVRGNIMVSVIRWRIGNRNVIPRRVRYWIACLLRVELVRSDG